MTAAVRSAPQKVPISTFGTIQAAMKSAEAELGRAKVALEEGRSDFGRSERLSAEGVISKQELERASFALEVRVKQVTAAEFQRDVAAHELEMARAARRQLRESVRVPGSGVEPWEIRSPVRGNVLRVLQESEGVITAGTPLVELADPSDLEVIVDTATLYRVYLGRAELGDAMRARKLTVKGPQALQREFGRWFAWSAFAAASRSADERRKAASRLRGPARVRITD